MGGILNQAHISKNISRGSSQADEKNYQGIFVNQTWLDLGLCVNQTSRSKSRVNEMGNTMSDEDVSHKILRCWGKTDRSSNDASLFHPAFFHIIDVANVARGLLNEKAPARFRNVFSEIYQLDPSSLISFLPFLIALHDIGKFSSAFQRMNALQHNRLLSEGFSFGSSHDLTHNQIGRNFIWYEWPENSIPNVSEVNRKVLREVVGGHHGQYLSPGELVNVRNNLKYEEPEFWKTIRNQVFYALRDLFLDPCLEIIPEPLNASSAVAELTGFTILCDWIGSDQRFFVPQPVMSLDEYLSVSIQRAATAITEDGFAIDPHSRASTTFSRLFPNISHPRPLQQKIDAIPDEMLIQPALIVIEAPTGEGKTEAALALAHKIGALHGTDEFYYALPTTATSNQMFKRVEQYLNERLNIGIGAKLVHGQAFLDKDLIPVAPMTNNSDNHEVKASLEWFSSKKRALLAPFGVGTIDQIELAALNVRHSSLRLAGLSGKVIILDEVHAYDTYMTTIIVRLLSWLKSLGATVILLSATLPANRRNELLQVYSNQTAEINQPSDYPLILVANENETLRLAPTASKPACEIHLEFLRFSDQENSEKAQWLLDQVKEGGCACWISNTVNRSQEIFQTLAENSPEGTRIILLHSRFPLEQRSEIEKEIVSIVGPDKANRPTSAIVVGTQVLEQSLDLDFDLMVSDLAPVDLLLQRAGRLHRHAETRRPANHLKPVLYVNCPVSEDKPLIKTDKSVYAPYFLYRTYQVIKEKTMLRLPEDYRLLVEDVYQPLPPDTAGELNQEYQDLQNEEERARQEAALRLLPEPDAEELFTSAASRLTFIESEVQAGWTVAKTRLGEQSINVIPLEDMGDVCKVPGSEKLLQKCLPANNADQLFMLRNQIRIGYQDIVKALMGQKKELPALFTGAPLLHDYIPLWLKDGKAVVTVGNSEFVLKLDPLLGLMIERKEAHE